MRTFIVPGHRVVSSGDWTLNDLSGSTGRLDILLRCVNSAFFLSHGIRKDTEIYLVLLGPTEAPKTLHFSGSQLRYLNPDERSTAALVRTALMKKCSSEWVQSTPGISVARKSFEDVVKSAATSGRTLLSLSENGEILGQVQLNNPVVILGDQSDLTVEEDNLVKALGARNISLGPNSLHSDHCITIINNEIDRLSSKKS